MNTLKEYIAEKLLISVKNGNLQLPVLNKKELEMAVDNIKYQTQFPHPNDLDNYVKLVPLDAYYDAIGDPIFIHIDDIEEYALKDNVLPISYMLLKRIYPKTRFVELESWVEEKSAYVAFAISGSRAKDCDWWPSHIKSDKYPFK